MSIQLTPRLNKAIMVASIAHRQHFRKTVPQLPYISHPFAVMLSASRITSDEDTLIACLLHDTIEDVPQFYNQRHIEEDFGQTVTKIVVDVTKNSSLSDWHQRANAYIDHLKSASPQALIVCLADKHHNLSTFISDYDYRGSELWQHFNSSPTDQLGWHQRVLQALEQRMPNNELLKDYVDLVQQMAVLVNRDKA